MNREQEKYFAEGVLYAVALLNRMHDQPGMCADILVEASLTEYDCNTLDEFEKEQLRIINKENRINLKGLKK